MEIQAYTDIIGYCWRGDVLANVLIGEQTLNKYVQRLQGTVSMSSLEDKISRLEERVGRVEEAINALRERVARVEGIVEQMDKRLNHIETELREFRREVNERLESLRKEIFGEISSLRKELNTRFYWLIGILITMWITIILTILFKAH